MTAHTPGPWATQIITMGACDTKFIRSSDQRTVAIITPQLPSETESNAALIAAAPDLLAALREVMAELDQREAPQGHFYRDTGGMILARAAIAKAEGR